MLAKESEIDVYLPADVGTQLVRNPIPPNLRLFPYGNWRRFFSERFPEIIGNYDVAWFSGPPGFSLGCARIPDSVRVVYDCMDDFLAFPDVLANPIKHARHCLDEVALVDRADLLFASSPTLARRIAERYQPSSSIVVVKNATSIVDQPAAGARKTTKRPPGLHMAYVGTVASWVDFALLISALDEVPDAVCHLVGPLIVKPPSHPRLKFHGPKLHPDALAAMHDADLLLMPFVVDVLTEGVNPVKLYEYIHAGVPALAVAYGESESFEDFVYLYRSSAEFIEMIKRASVNGLPPKKGPEAVARFLQDNSWSQRGTLWRAAIAEMLERPAGRRSLPHLAYRREQLSRIVGNFEMLARERAKQLAVHKHAASGPRKASL